MKVLNQEMKEIVLFDLDDKFERRARIYSHHREIREKNKAKYENSLFNSSVSFLQPDNLKRSIMPPISESIISNTN